ncbi:MAG: ATP-binding protein [Synergistetes bacterium]|nr:ATP-binding protein [Synergistota bacterium]MCX8127161.1 ATP-binding protein [Synergistota bacterium]MDW8191953.1 ATP-binding protein [Synergistota bacterium]
MGSVSGLKTITPYEFWLRIEIDEENGEPLRMLQVDDMVKVNFNYGNFKRVTTYGVIVEIETRWDSDGMRGFEEALVTSKRSFILPVYLARVVVTRIEPFVSVPPPPGAPAFLVEEGESDEVYDFVSLKRRKRALPVGILLNGGVAYLDLAYILGDNGAHINVSGVSGVAAKTSYATFLLYSLLETGKKLAKEDASLRELANSRAIVFNVKGEGLLFLDEWNTEWCNSSRKKEWEEMFRKMELTPKPFSNVSYYAPSKRRKDAEPDVAHRTYGVKVFGWDIIDIIKLSLLELMFDPEELSKNVNLQLAVSALSDILEDNYRKFVNRVEKELNEPEIRKRYRLDLESLNEEERVRLYLKVCGRDPNEVLTEEGLPPDFRSLIEFLKSEDVRNRLLAEEELEEKTIKAMARRLKAAFKLDLDRVWKPVEGLDFIGMVDKYEPPSYRVDWDINGKVTVIDIAKLRYRAQVFVVGAILKEVLHLKETAGRPEPVFIFLDELNKYAPRTGGGPLGAIFRDIAERGRSFRIIMIGAEQTASEVDYRVITQASTVVVGHQKVAELKKDEYAHLFGAQRERASTLLQGELIVDQPFLRVPMTIRFPLTPWATKEDAHSPLCEEVEGKESLRDFS